MRTWANLPAGLRSQVLGPTTCCNGSVHHGSSSPYDRIASHSIRNLLRTPARETPHARAFQRRGLNEHRLPHLQRHRSFSSTPVSRIRLDEDEDEDHEPPARTRAPARPMPTRMPARPAPTNPVSSKPVLIKSSPVNPVPSRPIRRPPLPSSPTMDMRSMIRSRDLKHRQAKRIEDAEASIKRIEESASQIENDTRLIEMARGVRDIQSRFRSADLVDLRKTFLDIEVKLQTLILQEKVHDLSAKFRSLPQPSSISQDIAASRFMDAEVYLDEITSDISRTSRQVWQISDAHVSYLEGLVYSSEIKCRQLEHIFCKVVYQTPAWMDQVFQSTSNVPKLGREFIKLRLRTLRHGLSSLQRVVQQNYLKPRASAREKIDRLLAEMNEKSQRYKELQEQSSAVNEGAFAVMSCLHPLRSVDLRVVNERGLGFEDFALLIDESRKRLGWLAHAYRSAWSESNRARGSFKDSSFWSAKDFTDVSRSSKFSEMSSLQVVKCRMFEHALKYKEMKEFRFHEQVTAKHLHDLYTGRLAGKKMNTSQLVLAWRQLDNNAPFEIKIILDWWFHEELHMMIRALDGSSGPFGPMFTHFDPNVVGAVKGDIKKLSTKFSESRKAFNVEFEKYKLINWHRLKIEEKLHKLGEPNLIRERGLFKPPKPLSRNKKRFDHWVQLYSSIAFRAWTVRKFNTVPHETIITATGEESTPYGKMCGLYLSFLQSSVPEIGSVMADRPRIRETRTPRRKRLLLPLFKRKFEEAASLPDKAILRSDSAHSTQNDLKPIPSKPPADESSKKYAPPTEKSAESSKLSKKSSTGSRERYFTPSYGQEDAPEKPADSVSTPAANQRISRSKRRLQAKARTLALQAAARRPYSTLSNVLPARINNSNSKSIDEEQLRLHDPLTEKSISDASKGLGDRAKDTAASPFWSHSAQRTPSGRKPIVHYCRSLESTEQVAQLFLNSKVIGFDMEWKAQASSMDSIQNNVSLIQIATEERIALFQVALFKPAKTRHDFIAPSLKKILESPHVTKVGVAIKGDTTRLRKFLGIETRSIFELSHLFRLVKHSQNTPKLVNKRLVRLSDQIEEHFGLPLEKGEDVRCSDWTRPLSYQQVQYAATDPYACICLFNTLEQKRQAMNPMPPLPAYAELNMPIVLPRGDAVIAAAEELAIPDAPDR